jgi:hypothetical protein
MRHRPRTARARAAGIALAVLQVGAAGACSGGRSDANPVAMLASTPQSAVAFEAVRDAWADPDHTAPAELRARLERFLRRFPDDGVVPFARVALALVAMSQGDLATADAELTRTASVPRGTTHDLRVVARARRLRLGGDAESALGLLRPLVGKSVDPLVRATFEEELTVTALATHRDYEAISYMDAWLRASAPDEKDGATARVAAIVQRLSREVLVGALKAMSVQRSSLGYGADIQRILAQRLVQIATTNGDAELARMLLEAAPQAFTMAGDAGTTLGELAASRRGLNVVEGRTIGLLLPTESPGLRDESADVLRGVLWALGLPRGSRPAPPSVDAGARSTMVTTTEELGRGVLAPCAPLEPAPESTEPAFDDAVRLVTHDDAGSADRTEVSLDELVGEGAAMVIAGLDGQTARRALRWGEQHGVPVIALVPPVDAEASRINDGEPSRINDAEAPGTSDAEANPVSSFGFVLGESRAAVLGALVRAEPIFATATTAPIADASEVASYPLQGGPFAGLMFGPPVSCDIPSTRAGEARFPIGPWQSDKTRAWIVSGSPACAADLVGELSAARLRGVVGLTLEASALLRPAPGLRVLSLRAGVVPEVDPRDPRSEEVRRFQTTLGTAGWWAALGRDAATLERAALVGLPVDAVSDPRAVADRRAAARDRLAAARARLWTSEAGGWAPDHTVKRTLCAAEAPSR